MSNLRQGENTVEIIGVLKENNLKAGTKNGEDYIGGHIVVQTNEKSGQVDHRINFYAKKLTKKNEVNNIYKGLSTIMRDYVSMAMCASGNMPLTEATLVNVRGQLEENIYKTKSGHMSITPQLKGFAAKRINPADAAQPKNAQKATFKIEGVIESIVEVMDEEEQSTGVVELTLVHIGYNNNAMKLKTLSEGRVAQYILDKYRESSTVTIWGNIETRGKVTEPTVTEGFAGDFVEEATGRQYTVYVLTSGVPVPLSSDDEKSYDIESVKQALVERQTRIDSKEKEEKATTSTKETPDW